jgi:hypothetical protein
VPASGIYRVSHSLKHAMEQRELYFEGSRRWSLSLSMAVLVNSRVGDRRLLAQTVGLRRMLCLKGRSVEAAPGATDFRRTGFGPRFESQI